MKRIEKDSIIKGINYLKKNLYFFNVSNSNIRDLAYKNYCYRKMYRKYKRIIQQYEIEKKEKTFSKYIWICWFQKLENAPDIVRACINSVKKIFKDREIIIITDDNIMDYVTFPKYIMEKRKKGIINNAHFSDLLRLRLLNQYGGLWLDSTVLVTGNVNNEFWENELFCFKEISLFKKEELPICASNWLIYATTNNEILLLTEKLLYEYWKRELYAENYFIFHLFFSMATKRFKEEWDRVPTFSNINNHILQFEIEKKYTEKRWIEIKKIANFHKLNRRISNEDKDSNYSYIIKEYKNA